MWWWMSRRTQEIIISELKTKKCNFISGQIWASAWHWQLLTSHCTVEDICEGLFPSRFSQIGIFCFCCNFISGFGSDTCQATDGDSLLWRDFLPNHTFYTHRRTHLILLPYLWIIRQRPHLKFNFVLYLFTFLQSTLWITVPQFINSFTSSEDSPGLDSYCTWFFYFTFLCKIRFPRPQLKEMLWFFYGSYISCLPAANGGEVMA